MNPWIYGLWYIVTHLGNVLIIVIKVYANSLNDIYL